MLKQREEIKRLIESGFDVELISFELDLPLELIKQCKLEIEATKNPKITSYTAQDIMDKRNKNAHSKMCMIKGKYRKLYSRSDKVEIVKPDMLSQKEIDSIRRVIATIEELIEKMKSLPKKEKKEIANSILLQLKKINEYQLPLPEAEKLYGLICKK